MRSLPAHFSRNSKIALYMRSYKLVKEFGEGVDRMSREMEEAGLPAPEYRQNEFMVYGHLLEAFAGLFVLLTAQFNRTDFAPGFVSWSDPEGNYFYENSGLVII